MKKEDVHLVLCFLACLVSLGCSKRGFILTAPKVLDAGSIEYFTLTLFDIPNGGLISLRLLKTHNDDVIAETEVFAQNKYNTWVEMTIPHLLDTSARLHIKGTFNLVDGYQINEIKEVRIRHKSVITFIQTDKPVYKPGQTVRFRILPMDSQLNPLDAKTVGDVWIQDPSGIRIAQWRQVDFSEGIVQLELPLSEEPVLGSWSINSMVENVPHSQTFSVEEYVLPKFEIIVTPPPYIMADAQAIITKICAQYTYGKEVDGVLKAKITYKKFAYENEERVLPSVEYEGLISGCYTFLVKAQDLILHSRAFGYRSLTVFAEVTENGTGIVQNSSTTLQITHTPLEMKFLGMEKGSKYFKPGLPFFGKLQVLKPDNKPAVSEKIEICASLKSRNQRVNQELCRNFTTDKKGQISFSIPPQDTSIFKIILEAKGGGYPVQRYDDWGIKINQPLTSLHLQAWFSPSGSHLQIEPITTEIQCDRLERVKIRYTTDKGSTIKFYNQVISRGRIVKQGSHHRTFYEADEANYEADDNFALRRTADDPVPRQFDEIAVPPVEESKVTLPPHVAEFILSFDARATTSPIARLLVFYVREDGEVVADSRKFHITNCLRNKVRLHFRHEQQYPNTEAAMLLSASPASLCGIGLVDKSVLLLQPEKQLDKEKVFKLMESYDVGVDSLPLQTSQDYCEKKNRRTTLPPPVTEPEGWNDSEEQVELRVRKRSMLYSRRGNSDYLDVIAAFEEAGMIVMSDFVLETRPCFPIPVYPAYPRRVYYMNEPARQGEPSDLLVRENVEVSRMNVDNEVELSPNTNPPKSAVEVRSYFPETWLWELHKIGESGEMAFKRELPHTVTEWVGSAICVHPKTGLGISDPSSITAFQPFFVSFTLPYAVVRGETVPVLVSVFNYLTECLPIKLSLEPSDLYKVIGEISVHKLCVCGGRSETHKFLVRPTVLGGINITVYGYSLEDDEICENEITARLSARDAVTRQLLVEAEGVPREETFNVYFCPQNSNGSFSAEIDLLLPENVVEGSARAFMSVTGDLMGPALNGLESLVRLPVGCGEQNMILFTPNIYVLDYLTTTGRITDEIKTKALNFMKTGYQRELRYRHSDGSYSAFGKNDKEGSLWLTAFVTKSFAQARRFIAIDEHDLALSTHWIVRKQLENGCFLPTGAVLHNAIKGGLSESDQSLAPLAAYVLISLLESGYRNEKLVSSATYCLHADKNPTTYVLALFAYATALAKSPTAGDYLLKLEERAVKYGNTMYWEHAKDNSRSISVEIAGYAILAMMELGGSQFVGRAVPVVRWLTKQRNANGGFVSTQDTVIALQALAKYASLSVDDRLNIGLSIESDDLIHSFNLDESNKLLTQTVKLPIVPTVADMQAVGDGCALTQFYLRYNVDSIVGSDTFDLNVAATRHGSSYCNTPHVGICMRFKVSGQTSNMVVVEVKMTSGYIPDQWSLRQLEGDKNLRLKRHEIVGNQINFYFSELSNDQKCFQFLVKNEIEVENEKAAAVKLYDYYQPDLEIIKNYEIPTTCSLTPLQDLPFLPPVLFDTDEDDDLEILPPLTKFEFPDVPENFIGTETSLRPDTTTTKVLTSIKTTEITTPETITGITSTKTITDTTEASNMTEVHQDSTITTTANVEQSDILIGEQELQLSDGMPEQQTENFSHLGQFVDLNQDLNFPDGLESNQPRSVTPPPEFISTTTYNEDKLSPDCPTCTTAFPENFTEIYCSSAFVLRLAIRDTETGAVKILHDITHHHTLPYALKEFGILSYDKACDCPALKQKSHIVFLLGYPEGLWHTANRKHQLKLTSSVHVIAPETKSVQPPEVKKARSLCDP